MKKIIGLLLGMAVVLSFTTVGFSGQYDGKKILYVDSYHEGYGWSDGITEGIESTFKGKGIELKIVRMDTKRNSGEDQKKQAGEKAKVAIEEFKPDVVIAADDNAAKYLIVPFYKDANLPFVFCGINWDASMYGFPSKNVTGMLEVNDISGLIDLMKKFSKGDRVGFIADDSETNRKEVEYYKKIFNIDVVPCFAKTFEEWKKGYMELQSKVDNLIVYNYISIPDWNKDQAIEFVKANTKVPTGTFQEEVMPYSIAGYLKVPQEQGAWAANAALKILDGTAPTGIPVAKNTEGKLMFNVSISQKAGIEIPFDLLGTAQSVIQ
jgi:ABC-type uncharacterized transport system substrate-binding protein